MMVKISEVARRCNVSRQAVRGWIEKGRLRAGDRGCVYIEGGLDRWVDENTYPVRLLKEK